MSREINALGLIAAAACFKERAQGDATMFGREVKEAGFDIGTQFLLAVLAYSTFEQQVLTLTGAGYAKPNLSIEDTQAVIKDYTERFHKFVAKAAEGKVPQITSPDQPLKTIYHYLFDDESEKREKRYYALQAHSLDIMFIVAVQSAGEEHVGKIVETFQTLIDDMWRIDLRFTLRALSYNYMLKRQLMPSLSSGEPLPELIMKPQFLEAAKMLARTFQKRFIDYFAAMDELVAKVQEEAPPTEPAPEAKAEPETKPPREEEEK